MPNVSMGLLLVTVTVPLLPPIPSPPAPPLPPRPGPPAPPAPAAPSVSPFRVRPPGPRGAVASGRIPCSAPRASGPAGTTGAVATGSADPAQATAAVRINVDAIGEIAIGADWSVVCNRDVAACATSPGAARAT